MKALIYKVFDRRNGKEVNAETVRLLIGAMPGKSQFMLLPSGELRLRVYSSHTYYFFPIDGSIYYAFSYSAEQDPAKQHCSKHKIGYNYTCPECENEERYQFLTEEEKEILRRHR